MTDNKKGIMFFVTIMFFFSLVSFVSANLLTEILSPFETTNFSDLYDSYYSIIDFIIYTILFVGLSQVTIGKRFEARGGKAVVVAIGLVLAIGLAISESYIGFNLRSFGPLAAAIFIFLVGFVIFLGIKSAGMESIGAGSITLVLTYFSIRSVSPSFFDWMISNQYLSWLHSVILIAVFISLYKIFRLFFSKKEEPIESKSSNFFKNAVSKQSDFISHLKDEKDELKFIKKNLEMITEESGKDSEQIIKDLLEIKKIIEEFGDYEKGKELISNKISSLINKEKLIHQKFNSLNELIEKISKLDLEKFNELQNNSKSLLESDRIKFKKTIDSEWKRIGVDKKIKSLEIAIKEYDKLFRHHLELLIVSLSSNKIDTALKQIDCAISIEKSLIKILLQMKKLEKRVKRSFNNYINK